MDRVDQWIRFYNSPNPEVKWRALKSLLRFQDPRILPLLLDALKYPWGEGFGGDVDTSKYLQRWGDETIVEPMIEFAEDSDPGLRELACDVLGDLEDRRATPVLIRRLDAPHSIVGERAAWALAWLRDPLSRIAIERKLAEEGITWAMKLALEHTVRKLKVLGAQVHLQMADSPGSPQANGLGDLTALIWDLDGQRILIALDPPLRYESTDYHRALCIRKDAKDPDKRTPWADEISEVIAIPVFVSLLTNHAIRLEPSRFLPDRRANRELHELDIDVVLSQGRYAGAGSLQLA
jgi:hypothetical protein